MISTDAPLLTTTTDVFDSPEGTRLLRQDEKAELFLAAVSTTSGGGTYEEPAARDIRIRELTRKVGLSDPGWLLRFVRWAREEANLRRVPSLVTGELVKARLDAKVKDETGPHTPGLNRVAINVAFSRADEPSLFIAHWRDTYGMPLPQPVKRGLADACVRLYSEFSALKYDTSKLEFRFGDVLELTHPKAKDEAQGALFEWLLNRRHGHKDSSDALPFLPKVTANTHVRSLMDTAQSRAMIREQLLENPTDLEVAGMTWENLSSLGPMDAAAWEAVIPQMSYMALLRNLRNFDEADISPVTRDLVKSRLSDSDAVERSRQFPFRYLSAFQHVDADWHATLESALELSLRNVPHLAGNTLILVDCSTSMWMGRENPSRSQVGGLFGAVIAKTAEKATLIAFGQESRRIHVNGPALAIADSLRPMGGTWTGEALKRWWGEAGPFDRVIIITDDRPNGTIVNIGAQVPKKVPIYTWNLGGYKGAAYAASPTRHTFGGLTDQGFTMIPTIESGSSYDWPF